MNTSQLQLLHPREVDDSHTFHNWPEETCTKLSSVYIVRRWHVKVHVDCDIGWRCHHLRRGLEGRFWGYAAGIFHENLEQLVQENAKVMWTHMGSRLLTMFIPNACLNIYQKILAGSSGSQLFCTGGLLLSGDLWIIKMLQCFLGFWFVAATPVNGSWCLRSQVQISSTGQGRRRRKPSQLSSGSDRSETRAVAWPEMSGQKVKNPLTSHANLLQKSPAVFFDLLDVDTIVPNSHGLSKLDLRFRARHQIPSQVVIRPVAVVSHRPDHLTFSTSEIYMFRLCVAV